MTNLAQFRVLVAVAETGGIRAAADRIHRTPSAVSMTLKQLEDEFGGALFEGERKTRLTRFGEFVVDHARDLLEHSDRVSRSINSFMHNGAGSIEIAVLPSITLTFLPNALRTFRGDRNAAVVRVRDLDSHAIIEAVSREVIDWGIASYHRLPDIDAQPLFSEPLSLVVRTDDPLCEMNGPIPWEALRDRPFIGNGICDGIDTPAFLAISERQIMHARSTLSLLSIVREGIGITVLPSLTRIGGVDGLRFLPIDDPNARRNVSLLSRADRNMSPAARRFATIMQELIAVHACEYGLDI
ncbi:LysR family transcriptional regulator [Paraburkholderia sp. Ac-20342]|uniref:LysR family transcriptional regulator n=1 Tax=Paraburkholderia sp. Ac-20342 TaxID=2703889 RepID=UPI00198106AC|nr:LysR family transcriptional regulator [Paraburkholderia sp. Ac-20342]MBN3849302.1 LysR family transcriptional regulator [Paraburkholderia sp. Ac-20342]